ncbi:MAG: hypothetical protein RJQ09_00695 [Cyclobacteriaceae bacterium]
MSVIGIEIPKLGEEQEIEVEVKINGIKKQFYYRVEIFYWEECPYPTEDRVECIKNLIKNYDNQWDLAHIGVPNDDYIPITFRKKRKI